MKMHNVIIGLALIFVGIFLFLFFFSRTLEEIEMEYHNRFIRSVEKLSESTKVVLMYNHMNQVRHPILDGYCLDASGKSRQRTCPSECFFTDDKSVLEFAHAVVFSARNLGNSILEGDIPPVHNPNQRWILFSMESPIHPKRDRISGAIRENALNLRAYDQVFNWTMSYRHDADIRVPFGRVLNKIPQHSNMYSNRNFGYEKTKLIAWISSDCYMERSGSSFLVAQLQQYVPIDIYGECGQYRCSHSHYPLERCSESKSCYKEIASSYKFYLALENSLCEDYVTESFFYALEFGMVPIVYGKANYTEIAVPGSFIDAMDFDSVLELAEHLKYLDTHPEDYRAYFKWRKNYFVTTTFHLDIAWCSLCSKLWEADEIDPLQSVASLTTSSPHPGSFQGKIINPSQKTVGLGELQKWSAANAFASNVCDGPPSFIINTTSTFTFPWEKSKELAFSLRNSKNEF